MLERIGRQPIDWTSGEGSRVFTMSSMCPSLRGTSLEAHLLVHPSQSKWKVKSTSKWRLCYSTEAEAILGSTFVRWLGYGPEHDEWIHEEELADGAGALLK